MRSYVWPFLGEIFLRVVDDRVGSERSHELEVLRAAHRCHVGVEVFGQLHRCGADGSGRAVNQNSLPLAEIRQPQAPDCVESSIANRRSFLEAHPSRLVRDPRALPHTDELGVCAEPEPTSPKDLVTDRELVDVCADSFDLSRQLGAEYPLLRSAQARDGAADERDDEAATAVGLTSRAVRAGHGHGSDLDDDLVLLGYRSLDI